MIIWEIDYGPSGDFYATKAEAKRMNSINRRSEDDGWIVRHEIKGGRQGLVDFLNKQFGAGYGKRPGGSSE